MSVVFVVVMLIAVWVMVGVYLLMDIRRQTDAQLAEGVFPLSRFKARVYAVLWPVMAVVMSVMLLLGFLYSNILHAEETPAQKVDALIEDLTALGDEFTHEKVAFGDKLIEVNNLRFDRFEITVYFESRHLSMKHVYVGVPSTVVVLKNLAYMLTHDASIQNIRSYMHEGKPS